MSEQHKEAKVTQQQSQLTKEIMLLTYTSRKLVDTLNDLIQTLKQNRTIEQQPVLNRVTVARATIPLDFLTKSNITENDKNI